MVHCMVSHEGMLYDASPDGVYDTLADCAVAKRHPEITALASHQGTLYDGGSDGKIRETFSGREIAVRVEPVHYMISYRGTLYDATYGRDLKCNEIYETFNSRLVVRRISHTHGVFGKTDFILCNGRLYNNSVYWGLYETKADRQVLGATYRGITGVKQMICADLQILKPYLKSAKKVAS